MTQRLYYLDAYCKTFEATVLSCKETDDGYEVILNQTAFFPEGGGQAADSGTINGISVLAVFEQGEEVIHLTKQPIAEGETVVGEIDWELRFMRMQSHSGEHLLSGIVHSMFGYSNAGFHMSDSSMTVDFSGPLSLEDIQKIEETVNRAIYQNVPITASFPTKEEAETISYRSKLEIQNGLRLITIKDLDCCACCAPHVAHTGEIGLVKILDFAPHRQGTRVELVAGIQAFQDYCALSTATKALMKQLSAPRYGITEAVLKQGELVNELRADNQAMSKTLALSQLQPISAGKGVYAISPNLSYDELRHCANSLTQKGAQLCILVSKAENNDYLYVISGAEDVSNTVKAFNTALNGKGGGRGGYAQGKVCADSEALLKETIETLL